MSISGSDLLRQELINLDFNPNLLSSPRGPYLPVIRQLPKKATSNQAIILPITPSSSRTTSSSMTSKVAPPAVAKSPAKQPSPPATPKAVAKISSPATPKAVAKSPAKQPSPPAIPKALAKSPAKQPSPPAIPKAVPKSTARRQSMVPKASAKSTAPITTTASANPNIQATKATAKVSPIQPVKSIPKSSASMQTSTANVRATPKAPAKRQSMVPKSFPPMAVPKASSPTSSVSKAPAKASAKRSASPIPLKPIPVTGNYNPNKVVLQFTPMSERSSSEDDYFSEEINTPPSARDDPYQEDLVPREPLVSTPYVPKQLLQSPQRHPIEGTRTGDPEISSTPFTLVPSPLLERVNQGPIYIPSN